MIAAALVSRAPAHADDRDAAAARGRDRRARPLGEHLAPTRTRGSAPRSRRSRAAGGRYGLVVFSDQAYEALPPGTRRGRPRAARALLQAAAGPRRAWRRRFRRIRGTSLQRRHEDLDRDSSSRTRSPFEDRLSRPVVDPRQRPRRRPGRPAAARHDHVSRSGATTSRCGSSASIPSDKDVALFKRLAGATTNRARRDAATPGPQPRNHTPFPWTLVAARARRRGRARGARAVGTAARMENAAVKAALGFAGARRPRRARRARGAPRGRHPQLADDAARRRRAPRVLAEARDLDAVDAALVARRARPRRSRRRGGAARDRALPRERERCRSASTTRSRSRSRAAAREQALAAVARDSAGARASQAETLLGVLVFTDVPPSSDPFQETAGMDPDQAQASLADFDDAVRADPENATAKYDLELALRALRAQGVRVGPGQQTGAGSSGRRGAGGGVPGQRLLMLAALVFLTPTAALVALAVLLPLAAFVVAERRVAAVRRVLRLRPPRGGVDVGGDRPARRRRPAARARSGPAGSLQHAHAAGAHRTPGALRPRHVAVDGRVFAAPKARRGWSAPSSAAVRLRAVAPVACRPASRR